MIGSDSKLFVEGSGVSKRIAQYGSIVKELHIVVFTLGSSQFREKQIAPNVWLYPTNSISRWLYVYDAIRAGKRLVREHGLEAGEALITTQDSFESGLVGLIIKKACHLSLEVQLHTDPFSRYFRGGLNFLRKMIFKKVLPKADHIRVVSSSLKTRVSKFTQAPVSVLPIYVEGTLARDAEEVLNLHKLFGWDFVVLSIARLTQEKNLSLALEVIGEVRKMNKNVGLVIVGDGPEKERLKSLAKKLGMEDFVSFEGWKEDVSSYYRSSDLFIQTSLYEGYGMALIEAGLHDLPIVSTPVGVATEFENGRDLYTCQAEDFVVWVNTVSNLIKDVQKRDFLKENMKKALKENLLSQEEFMNRLLEGWQKTVKNKK